LNDFIRILLYPFSFLFGLVVRVRNYLFNKNFFKEEKIDAKILSVGNLTTGGSGKTPLVIYLINLLKESGRKVGVLSRGYGRRTRGYFLVSDGEKIFGSVSDSGDEMLQTVMECNVPAAVSENRVEGAKRLISDSHIDAIVLDDAYQHRWIARDLNLLLFDQRFLNKKSIIEKSLLPSGNLREKFENLNRADLIIVNRKFSNEIIIPQWFLNLSRDKKIFTSYYRALKFVDVKSKQSYEIDDFIGQKSLVISGIARPYSLLKVLESKKIDIKNKNIFKDHKEYTLKEVEMIRKNFYSTNSHSVLTTQKDAVKLQNFSIELDDIEIFYLKIELAFDQEKEFNQIINDKLLEN